MLDHRGHLVFLCTEVGREVIARVVWIGKKEWNFTGLYGNMKNRCLPATHIRWLMEYLLREVW